MLFNYDEIIPGRLWVGTLIRPHDVLQLKSLGITSIINLQTDDEFYDYGIRLGDILKACREAPIQYRRVPIPDFDKLALAVNLPKGVAEVEAAMAPQGARVYLHCTAGINRSPTAAAAFLIRAHGLTARQAYKYLVARRECSPYLEVLERYEELLKEN